MIDRQHIALFYFLVFFYLNCVEHGVLIVYDQRFSVRIFEFRRTADS